MKYGRRKASQRVWKMATNGTSTARRGLRFQGAWETPQQEDECSVRMDDLEWDYEVGQLEGYRFQGAIFGVDGSCKDGTMGSGYCKLQGE